jgi:uncharacterized protein
MKPIFADTFYWIALTNPRDNWHRKVLELTETLDQVQIITTDEVLTEVLNFLCTYGPPTRRRTAQLIRDILEDPNIQVIEQTHASFNEGLTLYEQRLDKAYSLTDCISMQIMKKMSINDILTHDKHFTQEGFTILFQDN